MKIQLILLVFILTWIRAASQEITKNDARNFAEYFIESQEIDLTLTGSDSFKEIQNEKNEILAYCFSPGKHGFIVISADKRIYPVICYSETGDMEKGPALEKLIEADLMMRLSNIDKQDIRAKERIDKAWSDATNNQPLRAYEQWPEEGSTSTGGWIETQWHQNSPYNQFCPLIPEQGRALVGCPATAMAQIINYHQTINSTRFSSNDRYVHEFYQTFQVDDDWQAYNFLSFDSLNVYLEEIEALFGQQVSPGTQHIAALSLAAGFACKSLYHTSVSGTLSVQQAFDAYQRFGFSESRLLDSGYSDEQIRQEMINDIKEGFPVHLAAVDPAWQSGHNVVADGYRSNGFFHLNMGWGGTQDNWYNLPEGFPYQLTVFEGVVVDIYSGEQPQEYQVNFIVRDNNQNVIENCSVTINEVNQTITTNNEGICNINLPDGEYSFLASAEGFEDYQDDFTVNGLSIDISINLQTITGIPSAEYNGLKIWPNPTNAMVSIFNPEKKPIYGGFYNSEGLLLEEYKLNPGNNNIDISNYPKGVYILYFKVNNRKQSLKVIRN